MSPALNGSSTLERFEQSNASEIRNGIMFDFYPGLPHMYKYVCNKPKSKFLTSQVEYLQSCERQRSSLVTEHLMMKSSTLWVSKKGKREKEREFTKI